MSHGEQAGSDRRLLSVPLAKQMPPKIPPKAGLDLPRLGEMIKFRHNDDGGIYKAKVTSICPDGIEVTYAGKKWIGLGDTIAPAQIVWRSHIVRNGIFWLEIDRWGAGNPETTSVAHMFRHLTVVKEIPAEHRKIRTRDQFFSALEEWSLEYRHVYQVLYLAFHGDAGLLTISDSLNYTNGVSLAEIENALDSSGQGGIAYFASCGTIGVDKQRLGAFLGRTRFSAVCGYRGTVDWMDSSVFDLMLLGKLGTLARLDHETLEGARAIMKANMKGLQKRLQFRMMVNHWSFPDFLSC